MDARNLADRTVAALLGQRFEDVKLRRRQVMRRQCRGQPLFAIEHDLDFAAVPRHAAEQRVLGDVDDDEEVASEPWFAVSPNDVFPEQFPTFLFPAGKARDIFVELHGDLATARYWIDMQEKLRTHTQADVFSYPAEKRFSVRWNPA